MFQVSECVQVSVFQVFLAPASRWAVALGMASVMEDDDDDVEEGFGQTVVLTARIRSILRGCE